MTEIGNEVIWSDRELHDAAMKILSGEYNERLTFLLLRSIRDLKRSDTELEAARVKVFALAQGAADAVRHGGYVNEADAIEQAIADYEAQKLAGGGA